MGAFDDFKARSIAVKHHWSRVDPATVLGRSDGPAVVVDRVELTPRLGQALAGYGPTFSRWTRGWMHPLYATLVLTDDGGGNRWLAIGFDLHAGTRWLVERVALGTAALGVGVESIFVTATHNHASPGGMYGVDFYDKLVANFESGGFDDSWPQEIVDRIVDRVGAMAARIAAGSGRNPRLVYGEALVWGPIWQRALCAHLANFGSVATMTAADIDDVVAKASEKLNGEKAPATNDPRFAAVDARVRTLTWESDGEPVAVFAFVAATPTMFHSGASISGGDGLGYAARYAELQLGAEGKKVYVSANGGPHGDTFLVAGTDVGAFIREREDAIAKWEKLAPFARKVVEVGARIGEGMVRAVAAGRAAPEDTEVRGAARLSPCPKPCFSERLMAGEPVSAFTGAPKNAAPVSGGGKAEPDPRVGVVGEVGNAMLAGDPFEAGVGARTWPNKSDTHPPPADLDRGVRGDYTGSDPQSPKTVALGNTILGVATAPEHR